MLGSDDASLVNEGNDEHDSVARLEAGFDVGGDGDADEAEARTRAEVATEHYSGGAPAGA